MSFFRADIRSQALFSVRNVKTGKKLALVRFATNNLLNLIIFYFNIYIYVNNF